MEPSNPVTIEEINRLEKQTMAGKFISPEKQRAVRKKQQTDNNQQVHRSYRLPTRPSTPTKPMPPIPLPVAQPAEEKSNVISMHSRRTRSDP